jgi:NAD(P)-dependent dehydrogenase (short-subunit alcohol dehydrogenase family)
MEFGNLFSLKGKVAAVIGAASGIGEAVAVGCAQYGAEVHCLDINEAGAQRTAEIISTQDPAAHANGVDISDADAVDHAFDNLVSRSGQIDIVVCTPSINVRKPILAYSGEEFDRVISVNLKGNFNVIQAAGRHMTTQGSGSIILFSSIRSQIVEPGQSVYAATKAGIVQMARTAAAEFGPSGVRVNAIAPGVVETPLTAPIKAKQEWYDAYASRNIMERWAEPGEMVGAALFLASQAASYVTGTVLFVDGGWTAVDGRFQPPGV